MCACYKDNGNLKCWCFTYLAHNRSVKLCNTSWLGCWAKKTVNPREAWPNSETPTYEKETKLTRDLLWASIFSAIKWREECQGQSKMSSSSWAPALLSASCTSLPISPLAATWPPRSCRTGFFKVWSLALIFLMSPKQILNACLFFSCNEQAVL